MNGKHFNAVVYSEYSGNVNFEEPDRLMMDKIVEKSKSDWNTCTFAKEGTQTTFNIESMQKAINMLSRDKPEVNPNPFRKLSVMSEPHGYGNWLEFKNLYKGEENLLKIIVKNIETGKQKCIDIDKDKEIDPVIGKLKVGMKVYYLEKMGKPFEFVEVVKIVGKKPEPFIPPPFPWQYDPFMYWNSRRAMKTTFTTKFWEDIKEMREAKKAKEEYEKKPYFNVKLDIMKGKADHKENLEKMKFPCWVTYGWADCSKKRHLGQLVTGYPKDRVEYQLICMEKQVGVGDCCTVWREYDLEKLMKNYDIEVIKGETQCWKIGKFNV